MLKKFKPGSNISILDTIYEYPKRNSEGKWNKDFIDIIYKDNDTGKKYHEVIYEPEYEYFMLKPEISTDHNLFFASEKDCEPIRVKFNGLLKDIAERTGNLEAFYDNIRTGKRQANNGLHYIPEILNSDMNIEDHYRLQFTLNYQNSPTNITKAFFDIEADTINMRGDFPELGECPVNAISYLDETSNKMTIFLLRNSNNPLVEQFEKNINSRLFKELREFIIYNAGGIKQSKKYGIADLKFEFQFFDEENEIGLIKSFFDTVNRDVPDSLLAWNMAFDIPYLYERVIAFGYDPKYIMCHPDFKEKVAKYYIDTMHKNEYEARGDRVTISGYTSYLDLLIHFASRRKGQKATPNFKLDTVGEAITGIRKLDYSHITRNISKLPYLDYKTFVFYNIMDTIVEKCIETKTNDIGYIYNKCLLNNCRYAKGHRQTVYLTNRATKEFRKDGYIIGNNVNKNNVKKKFAGALVGEPLNNSDYSFIRLPNGKIIMIANNSDDFDYTSLYPSITLEHNMAPNTIQGKLIINHKIYDLENPFNFEFYERGGNFLDDLNNGNYIEFCCRWFNLPSYKELVHFIRDHYTNNELPIHPFYDMDDNGNRNPIKYYSSEVINKPRTPIVYGDDKTNKPIHYRYKYNKDSLQEYLDTIRG